MQKYTSFRIHRDTYAKLRKLRNKLKADSIDEVINHLLKVESIHSRKTPECGCVSRSSPMRETHQQVWTARHIQQADVESDRHRVDVRARGR